MVEKYFIWRFEEYEWCGRTEYKKVVCVMNLTYDAAFGFCTRNQDLRMEFMNKLDDSYEK